MNYLSDILDAIQALIVTIPLDNLLAVGYVVFSAVLSLFALLTFGGTDGGGLGGGGGLS